MNKSDATATDVTSVMLLAAQEKLAQAGHLLEIAARVTMESKSERQSDNLVNRKFIPVELAESETCNLSALLSLMGAFRDTHRQILDHLTETKSPLATAYHDAWKEPLFAALCLEDVKKRCDRALEYGKI